MVGKYKVITLCGSTKFKDDFLREQKRLTLVQDKHTPESHFLKIFVKGAK